MTDFTPTVDWNRPDEMLSVVDEQDREIGGERRDVIHQRNLLHRAVHVFVFGQDGRVLLQQRSSRKDTFPLHWECVGGHLSPSEKYADAAAREVQEELGVQVASLDLLCKLDACPVTGYEFIEVYRATISALPQPHEEEVIAIQWLTSAEARAAIEQKDRLFSPSFLHSVGWSGVLGVCP